MTFKTLIARSLRFHWCGHLGVLLGAAVGSAALIGALVVGDSVRLSLRELALQRLGWVDAAMAPPDRFFTQQLADKLNPYDPNVSGEQPHAQAAAWLKLPGTAARQDGSARANLVNILGVTPEFLQASATNAAMSVPSAPAIPKNAVILNEALAEQLRAKPGDDIVLRIHKPSALSRDVPITPQSDASVALRLKVHSVVPAARMGNFSLQANQTPPLNAILNREELAEAAGLSARANLIVAGKSWASRSTISETKDGQLTPLSVVRLIANSWLPEKSQSDFKVWRFGTSEEASSELNERLARFATPSDLGLRFKLVTNQNAVELSSERIFLDSKVPWAVRAGQKFLARPIRVGRGGFETDSTFRRFLSTNAQPLLTYLVNQLRAGERSVPYSMVSAAGSPWTSPDMKDEEILINQWLADDMRLKVGDKLELAYFLAESGANLVERTNRFRVSGIVSMDGIHGDSTLMPEFPGLAKAESTHEWDAGFPLLHKIRDEDEAYWKKYRGTPKAFVTLAAGQKMWGNRFGELTAIRFPIPTNLVEHLPVSGTNPPSIVNYLGTLNTATNAEHFRAEVERSAVLPNLKPADFGFRFEPVRAQALAAASQSQDFGGLFIGFSFFLILAALILMALLFQFGIEQRTNEVGTLLALGFTPKSVRNLLLGEGAAVAFVGGVLGVLGGVGYAKAMLYGLTTLWRDAVGASALHFHATPLTLIVGLFASVVVCAVTIWIVLRRQARRPARELLAEGADLNVERSTLNVQRSSASRWIALGSGAAALAMIGWAMFGGDGASAGLFFGAGALLLMSELAAVAVLLSALDRSEASRQPTLGAMGLRNATRRRTRSLASVALLACGSFLVAAIGANRLDAGRDATKRSSGTGGFALFGEATLPVVRDLNTQGGREFFGLDENATKGVSVVPFRVRDGDDASCLNLNRAQTPRLLGAKPELLAMRKAFTFAKVLKGLPVGNPWELLRSADSHVRADQVPEPRGLGGPRSEDDAIPAIGDAASIQWALGKKLGDTIEYTDERGRKFKVRLVAGVANSILQGNLIIDEAEFVKRFPSEAGHRMFLIDVPSNTDAESNRLEKTSAAISRALQDVGLELTPTTQRLAAFNAVQNTYLNTFQVLGGLGLLLGSAGLGVVVLRNVLERRGELGLLQAVGFRRRSLHWLVLSEHGGLLGLGLAVGITAAVAAVLPVLLAPGAETHYVALAATLAGVLASGLAWTWVATRLALRGELLKALRNE